MLSNDELGHVGDESAEKMAALEVAMLAAVGAALLSLKRLDIRSANKVLVSLMAKLNSVMSSYSASISKAVSRDLTGAITLHAVTEAERIAGAAAASQLVGGGIDASVPVGQAVGSVIGMQRNMVASCKSAYGDAIAQAWRDVATLGHRVAMERAVADMAHNGLTAYTYQRRSAGGGLTTVHVPVDVGVRREIRGAGLQAMNAEELAAAKRYGRDLVEVNSTTNARPSHAEWQGKIYSISGDNPNYRKYSDACRVGDRVNGIDGFNCGHRIAATVEGAARAFGDPLDGTGYTPEEARKAVSKQRRIENEIRKLKREREVLKLNGLDGSEVNRRIRVRRGELSNHIAEHPKLLHRLPANESIYDKARAKVGALGGVHLDAAQRKRIERAKTGEAVGFAAARGEWEARALDDLANVISAGKQNKHVPGTKEYATKVEQVKKQGYRAPSRLSVSVQEAERLVRENAGKGRPTFDRKGRWNGKEVCSTRKVIGYIVDKDGNETPTRCFTIHYGKNDVHIVPAKDDGALWN